jgi:hypothetical protein
MGCGWIAGSGCFTIGAGVSTMTGCGCFTLGATSIGPVTGLG